MDILSILREHDLGPNVWRLPNVEAIDGIALYKERALGGMTTALLQIAVGYAQAGMKTMFVAYEDTEDGLRANAAGNGFDLDHPNLTLLPSNHAWPTNDPSYRVAIFDTARPRWRGLASMVMSLKDMRDLGTLVICGWQVARDTDPRVKVSS